MTISSSHMLRHHAYSLVGDRDESIASLCEQMRQWGISVSGNPDFRVERYPILGIDDARALAEAAGRTGITPNEKIFIVAFDTATREAQNALLKTLEEPAPRTYFFLVVPTAETLLPTLRSRVEFLRGALTTSSSASSARATAHKFLKSAAVGRLKMVDTLLQRLKDEEPRARAGIIEFIDALEVELASRGVKEHALALAELLRVKRYARDRAPSFKILLEHLALLLPRV